MLTLDIFTITTLLYLVLHWLTGGPKLRKWYGAPELLPKDGSVVEEEEDYPGNMF